MGEAGHCTPSAHTYIARRKWQVGGDFSIPVGRSIQGEYGWEVDIAKEDVEGEEGKSYQVLVEANNQFIQNMN